MFRLVSFAALALILLGGIAVSQQVPTSGSRAAPATLSGSGAAIQVYAGSAFVPGSSGLVNGMGSVDLGKAPVTTVKPAVFTVRNAGTADLVLSGPVRLPRGFTLVRSFGTQKLAPGATTSFVVALNSAAAGKLGGKVSFGTNGTPQGQFRFTVTGTAQGPPSYRIVDNSDPDFRTVGSWGVIDRGFQGSARVSAAGAGSSQAVWTFRGLKPGRYQLSATWPAATGQATNARFSFRNGTRAFAPIAVDQRQTATGLHDAGTGWQRLGNPLHLTADTLTVMLSDQADGAVVADAVRLERVGYPGQILVPGDRHFAALGGWAQAGTNLLQSTQTARSATWTFTGLVPGRYRLSTTWTASPQASAAALFAVPDGDHAKTETTLDQRQAPHDLHDAGANWADLGGADNLFTITSTKVSVRLLAPKPGDPSGCVLAGPMRLERIRDHGHKGGGPLIDTPNIVRFLEQSTWGPNDALINHFVNDLGGDPVAFLNEQFAAPISSYPMPALALDDYSAQCHGDNTCFRDNYTLYSVQNRFFTNALYQPDQLRQRVSFALHQIMIVSGYTDDQVPNPDRYIPYLQIFDYNAFGNYRDILGQISLNPAMGHYLNILYSSPPHPNENYAREVMQLFSVGLNLLNPDGTLQLDQNGLPIPTYTQDTVNNLARVFTGFTYAPPQQNGVTNYVDAMVERPGFHDMGSKTLLQYPNAVNPVLPPNQNAVTDVTQALDNIFYHPNVGPFICSQLIQKLVTSNPSPAYVARVESWFEDDGTGARGNLGAVVQAILLDPEARGDAATNPAFGHLRDAILLTCNVLRAFNATSYDGSTTSDGYLNIYVQPLGMDLFRAPTVFSYYPPNFNTPGYAPLLGPEFAILDSVSTLKRANFMNMMTFGGGIRPDSNGPNGTALNLNALQAMTPDAMLDYLNNLLMHGTMSDDFRNTVIQAVNAVDPSNTLKRARTAVYLVVTSAQYEVQQ